MPGVFADQPRDAGFEEEFDMRDLAAGVHPQAVAEHRLEIERGAGRELRFRVLRRSQRNSAKVRIPNRLKGVSWDSPVAMDGGLAGALLV